MLDALQYYRLGSAVDPADRAPVTVSHPDPVFVAAQPPNRWMWRERVCGENLDPQEKRPLVACRQCREILGGNRRNDQPHHNIIDDVDQPVKDNCLR
jgi:hypothetical protein